MSDDCNVCDFPAEFCCCVFGPQCTECGMQCDELTTGCPAIYPNRASGSEQ